MELPITFPIKEEKTDDLFSMKEVKQEQYDKSSTVAVNYENTNTTVLISGPSSRYKDEEEILQVKTELKAEVEEIFEPVDCDEMKINPEELRNIRDNLAENTVSDVDFSCGQQNKHELDHNKRDNKNAEIHLQQEDSGLKKTRKVGKTAAQRSKEYRERKKIRKALTSLPTSQPKTNAQRCKEYRQRQKLNLPSTSDAQRCKAYREKLKQIKLTLMKELGIPSVSKMLPKTNAQRCREYRQRQKLSQLSTSDSLPCEEAYRKKLRQMKLTLMREVGILRGPKNRPQKTNAELCREYRERKKLNQSSTSDAPRCKAYRDKLQGELTSINEQEVSRTLLGESCGKKQ